MTISGSSLIKRALGRASRDRVGGALSYAAVPRAGLGPATPPLCRYAERTTDPILAVWEVFHSQIAGLIRDHDSECLSAAYQTYSQPWRLAWAAQRHKGGGRRPGDSRGAAHAKRQGGYRHP